MKVISLWCWELSLVVICCQLRLVGVHLTDNDEYVMLETCGVGRVFIRSIKAGVCKLVSDCFDTRVADCMKLSTCMQYAHSKCRIDSHI